jgi:hypothetical protein
VTSKPNNNRRFPGWGLVGVALIAVFWPVNWFFPGTRTIWAFFPLWAGFILTVDGLVYLRKNTSQFERSKRGFISLFLISAPSWWLFEVLNRRVQNWHYLGVENFSSWEYFFLSTINFSVVIPAIFESAELLTSFDLFSNINIRIRVSKTKNTTSTFFLIGSVMLAVLLIWPVYFFPFLWLSVYFILEPINIWLGNASLADYTQNMNWKPVLYLFSGALLTGIFWEFWNFFSYPKWVYTIPFVGYFKIFEMPFLGYFGYLPFALEICVIFQITNRFLKIKNTGLFPIFEETCMENSVSILDSQS